MQLIDVCPVIRYARLHRNCGYTELRRCYDCRLFVFSQGEAEISANGRIYSFSKGTAIFLPPGTEYCFIADKNEGVVFYALDFDLTSEYAELTESRRTPSTADFDESAVLLTRAPAELSEIVPFYRVGANTEALLSEICALFLRRTPLYSERASGLLKTVLAALSASRGDKPDGICERVLGYLYENYTVPELSNSEIAAAFGYHPYHLGSIIKEKTGKSIHRHLLEFRLSVAADMLFTTDLAVNDIFWRCGFGSVSHFIKAFGDFYGTTPTRYRKSRADSINL